MIEVTVFNGSGDKVSDAALTVLETLLHRPGSDIAMHVTARYSDVVRINSGKISIHLNIREKQ